VRFSFGEEQEQTQKKLTRYVECHRKYLHLLLDEEVASYRLQWGLRGVRFLRLD
jgi:hypothetical protein